MLTESMVREYIERVLPTESNRLQFIKEEIDRLQFEHEEIFPSQMNLLRFICHSIKAERILELGTFVGYSAIGLAEVLQEVGEHGHIITVERAPENAALAQSLIEQAGLVDRITVVAGDAREECRSLRERGLKFDLVFMDVFEGDYPELFESCVLLLRPRGVLLVDNVLMATVEGWTSQSNVIEAPDGPITANLVRILELASADKRLACSIIPSGSGMLLCTRLP